MLLLTVSHPERQSTQVKFLGDTVTIGRTPDNQLCLEDDAVSAHHGRLERRGRQLVYTDVGSTNGSIVYRDGKALALTGRQFRGQTISDGDRVKIGAFTIDVECDDPLFGSHHPHVLQTQSLAPTAVEISAVREIDLRQGERILALLLDAQATLGSLERLCQVLRDHLFRFFPNATHLSLVLRDQATGTLKVVYHDGRSSARSEFRISHTIVRRVMREALGVLLVDAGKNVQGAQSIVLGGIQTAICAPLRGTQGTFGALQLDIRERRDVSFSSSELALLVTLADFVALLLENHRYHVSSRRGLIVALEQLLSERAARSPHEVSRARRLGSVALAMARGLKLAAEEQELLAAACLLTAWPSSERPGLVLPDAFLEAPFVASCREERMDGSGPLGLPAELLSPVTRILCVASAVAAASEQPDHRSNPEIISELELGRGVYWDPACLDALLALVHEMDELLEKPNLDLAA